MKQHTHLKHAGGANVPPPKKKKKIVQKYYTVRVTWARISSIERNYTVVIEENT